MRARNEANAYRRIDWRGLMLALTLTAGLPGCAQLFFHPMDRAHRATPAEVGLPFEDVKFAAGDGIELHGWFLPAFGKANATVVFMHGNSEDIGSHLFSVAWMPPAGYNVFMFDYRGYGASAGTPTFDGVFDDIESAFATVLRRVDIDPDRIIVYGQSQGGAMAIYAVTHSAFRHHVRALVIDSAFASYRRIAKENVPRFLRKPLDRARWIPETFSPEKVVASVSPIPLLIMHARDDRIVPVAHASTLYAAAEKPKTLWIHPNGRHIRLLDAPADRERLLGYFAEVLAAPVAAPVPGHFTALNTLSHIAR